MAAITSFLARAAAVSRYYLRGLYKEISEKSVFIFAQAIAFKVLITVAPILLLAAGLTGQVLRSDILSSFEQIRALLEDFLPAYQSGQILEFLRQLLNASGAFTAVGAIGLILAAMTLATTVRIAVSGAFEQDWHEQRTILGGYVFDLRMVAQVGLFFALTMALTVAAQALNTEGQALLRWLGLGSGWIGVGWQRAFNVLGLLLPFLVTTAMFFQLFYFIPRPHPPKRSAAVGALVTAVLWEAAKQSFTFYAEYVGRFERYGDSLPLGEKGVGALGSTFGLILAFVLWIYYSGIVIMIGAIVGSLHEHHRRTLQAEADDVQHADSKLDAAAHETPLDANGPSPNTTAPSRPVPSRSWAPDR